MPTKQKRVMVQLNDDLYNDLMELARAQDQSLSATCRQVLFMYVSTMKKTLQILQDNNKMDQIIKMMKDANNE